MFDLLLQATGTAPDTVLVHPGPMVFPPFIFGVITLVILVALMGVTFAFRNMAQAHPEKSAVLPYEPVGHPGTPIIDSEAGGRH